MGLKRLKLLLNPNVRRRGSEHEDNTQLKGSESLSNGTSPLMNGKR